MALKLGKAQVGLLIAWPLLLFLMLTRKPHEDIAQYPVTSVELEVTDINGENENTSKFAASIPIQESTVKPLVTVLLSSLPRSGSTVIGELLQTMDQNSVYFFEPLWVLKKTKCLDDEACIKKHIKSMFSCSFSYSFEFLLKTNAFLRDPYLKNLDKEAKDKLNGRELCSSSTSRVLKLIRARLSSMEDYFNLTDYNVKIVYLTRDPRGTLKSVKSFGWIYDPQFRCGEVKSDVEAFENLVLQYPSNVFHVQYEKFCLNPEQIVTDIYKFLYGSDFLPAATKDYLETHMGEEKTGVMSTQKNSTVHFQLWRQSITNSLLQDIESPSECKYIIDWMGHNLFENDVNARNENITLFKIT